MSKEKAPGKAKKKSAQLVLRIEALERDAFVRLCKRLDTTAAREIRRFMREMVAKHAALAPDAPVDAPVEAPKRPKRSAAA